MSHRNGSPQNDPPRVARIGRAAPQLFEALAHLEDAIRDGFGEAIDAALGLGDAGCDFRLEAADMLAILSCLPDAAPLRVNVTLSVGVYRAIREVLSKIDDPAEPSASHN